MPHIPNKHHFTQKTALEVLDAIFEARVSPVFILNFLYYPIVIESLCLYLLCLSAALLCYTGFQNYSLIRSTSCSCSTCCFGSGFQLQNLQDFIKISRALIKDIFLMAMSDREEYLFNWFCYRLTKALQTLYLQDLADLKIKGYKRAKKWLEREERVDARERVSKLWKAVTLVHNRTDIFLYDWRDFRREYYLERSKVEEWNENDECRRIMNVFPFSWGKGFVKEEHKRAKNSYTAKMMVPSTTHRQIKEWVRKSVTPKSVFQSLQNALLVTVDTERE